MDSVTRLRARIYTIDQEITRLRNLRNQICDEFYRIPREEQSERLNKRLELIETARKLNDARTQRHALVLKLERVAP